jgi:hypothetical protein
MTTQTTQSAARAVERETSAFAASSLSFPASLQEPWLPWPARHGGRLIANARLESPATVRKQSIGTRPNRKWIAIFHFAPLATHHLPLATALPWPPWPAHRGGRLIANARLEFPASARKQSIGTSSNRKWIAIFQFTPQLSRSSFDTALPWPPWPARRGGRLVANGRLESPATARKQIIGTSSNRKWIPIFRFALQFSRSTLATCHLPLATAIQITGAAIRTPRKPLKT